MHRKNRHSSRSSSSRSSSFTGGSSSGSNDQLVAVTPMVNASPTISNDHFTSESTSASFTSSSSSVEELSLPREKK